MPCFSCIHFSIAIPMAWYREHLVRSEPDDPIGRDAPQLAVHLARGDCPSACELDEPSFASTSAMSAPPALPSEMKTSNGCPCHPRLMFTYIGAERRLDPAA